MKIIIISVSIITFSLGFFSAKSLYSKPEILVESKRPSSNLTLSSIRSSFKNLEENDLSEYLNLTNQRDKFIKANEIYSKAFLMLLATMGLKVGHQDGAQQEQATLTVINHNKWNQLYRENEQGPMTHCFYKEDVKRLIEKNHLSHTSIEKPNSITSTNIEELGKAYLASSPINQRNSLFELLNGQFSGKVEYLNFPNSDFSINLSIQSQFRETDYYVDYKLEIKSYDHGSIINTSSKGTNSKFKSHNGLENKLIIELSPLSYALIHYNEEQEAFEGDIFERKQNTINYKKIGKIYDLSK